jgi:hypothetical protein
MRISSQVGYLLGGVIAVGLLAGCAGGGSAPARSNGQPLLPNTATRPAEGGSSGQILNAGLRLSRVPLPLAPGRPKGFVNVARVNGPRGNQTITSDIGTSAVLVFGWNGDLNAILVDGLVGPQGITTDAAETLYVANTLGQNVMVYRKPYSSVTTTLNDSDEYPVDAAVSTTGVVGVMNIGEPTGGFGSVSFYAKGSTSPCANVSSPYWARVFFGAFDASGDLFIDGVDPLGHVAVGEVLGGCKARSIKTLKTSNAIASPGGVQVADGHILIADQGNKAIYTYALPTGGSLGSPSRTTLLKPTSIPVGIAMIEGDRKVWVADATLAANATEYTYPAGVVLKDAYAQFVIEGIAVNPAARP